MGSAYGFGGIRKIIRTGRPGALAGIVDEDIDLARGADP
jgi:hypothetical protein